MIEITNIKGGRKRYNEDIRCLQELAIAFTEIFKVADVNFVVSGCQNHQEGYVWLNGKIRYIPASDSDMDYIICNDTDGAEIPYQDSSEHIMCHNYDAMYSSTPKSPCITKENGEFPRLKDALFGNYGVLKNSSKKQYLNSPVYFNNAKFASVVIDNNTTIKTTDKGLEISTRNGNYRFRLDSPIFEKYDGDTIEWQINGNDGNILMPKLFGSNLKSTDILAKSVKIKGKTDENTVALSKFPKHLKYKYLVSDNGKNVADYTSVLVSQEKERVMLRGTIENTYILGKEDHFLVDFDTLQNSTVGSIIAYSGTGDERLVLFKSILRLPDEVDGPNKNRLPGVMIMSNELHGKTSQDKQFSGNVQLIIGADKHLYFLMKTGQYLSWLYSKIENTHPGPYINFSFYVD